MRLDVEQRLRLDAAALSRPCANGLDELDQRRRRPVGLRERLAVPRVGRPRHLAARKRGAPIVVDPKAADVSRYAGATVLKPNSTEAAAISGVECADDRQAEIAAKIVHERAEVASIVLTRGSQGMTVFDPSDSESAVAHVATIASEVFDVSGAGDTVAAALALAAGQRRLDDEPRRASPTPRPGVAVGKRGTAAVVSARELAGAFAGAGASDDPKIVDDAAAADESSPTGRRKG